MRKGGRLPLESLPHQHPREKGPQIGTALPPSSLDSLTHSPRRATPKRVRNIKAFCDEQEGNKTFWICRNRWRNCRSNLGLKNRRRSREKLKRAVEPLSRDTKLSYTVLVPKGGSVQYSSHADGEVGTGTERNFFS